MFFFVFHTFILYTDESSSKSYFIHYFYILFISFFLCFIGVYHNLSLSHMILFTPVRSSELRAASNLSAQLGWLQRRGELVSAHW